MHWKGDACHGYVHVAQTNFFAPILGMLGHVSMGQHNNEDYHDENNT